MVNIFRNNWFVFLTLLILIFAVALYEGPYLLKILKSAEDNSGRATPADEKINSDSTDHPINTSVEPVDNFDGSVINYTDNGFEPSGLGLTQTGSKFGCLLKIINKSGQDLTIRLGPYEKSVLDNYGQKYPTIPPDKYLIIDPRFGLRQEEFLNLYKPQQKFKLDIDQSCLPNL